MGIKAINNTHSLWFSFELILIIHQEVQFQCILIFDNRDFVVNKKFYYGAFNRESLVKNDNI